METLETHEHDVLVIGAGGAGLRAAIEASAQGASVGLVCKSLLGKAHTVMAEGGIAAALAHVDPQDGWETHFRDTMKGGSFLNHWRMAQLHAQESPDRVRELEQWGALFDRTPDGRILQRAFGGHTWKRLGHVGDRTGLEMIRTLQDRGVHQGLEVYMECTITRLLKDGDRIAGALAYWRHTGQFVLFRARAIVIATGGIGKAYQVTSNSWEYTGDGQALAYDAGAELIDMEFVQFHPTGMVWPPGVMGLLVTEGVRGEGGILRNSQGERFMWKYLPEARRHDRARALRRRRSGGGAPRRQPAGRQLALGPGGVRPPRRARRHAAREAVRGGTPDRGRRGRGRAARSARPLRARLGRGPLRDPPRAPGVHGALRRHLPRPGGPRARARGARAPQGALREGAGRGLAGLQPGLAHEPRPAQHDHGVRGHHPLGGAAQGEPRCPFAPRSHRDGRRARQGQHVRAPPRQRDGRGADTAARDAGRAQGAVRGSEGEKGMSADVTATPASGAREAVLRVWRGDPSGGREVEYRVPIEPGMVVLDAVHWIQGHQAPDLAVRWNCKAAKCGSCSAEVNGKPSLMCKSRLDHFPQDQPLTVRPMKTFPVIRDLVTDVSWNYEVNRRIPAFKPRHNAEWK